MALKPGLDSAKPLGIKPSFLSQIKHPEWGGHGIKLHGILGVARNWLKKEEIAKEIPELSKILHSWSEKPLPVRTEGRAEMTHRESFILRGILGWWRQPVTTKHELKARMGLALPDEQQAHPCLSNQSGMRWMNTFPWKGGPLPWKMAQLQNHTQSQDSRSLLPNYICNFPAAHRCEFSFI